MAGGVNAAIVPCMKCVRRAVRYRMIKRRSGAGLLFKSAHTCTVLGEVSREEFQRYFSMQLRIFREINSAHAAFAEQRKNPVMRHRLTGLEFNAVNQHFCRSLVGRRIHKVATFLVRREQ